MSSELEDEEREVLSAEHWEVLISPETLKEKC